MAETEAAPKVNLKKTVTANVKIVVDVPLTGVPADRRLEFCWKKIQKELEKVNKSNNGLAIEVSVPEQFVTKKALDVA